MRDTRNLLNETITAMTEHGHAPEDVIYIGSRDGYSCTWDEFTRLADVDYFHGYGGQEVAGDLEIHFSDGSWLERGEYDGSEWWEYRSPFVPPAETKPIVRLVRDDDHYSWDGLGRLNGEKEDWES